MRLHFRHATRAAGATLAILAAGYGLGALTAWLGLVP
jgi:hypothetical protein